MRKITNKHLISIPHDNHAISEIMGTILLLGIIVILASGIYYVVLSSPLPDQHPKVNLVATLQGDNIIITHKGGHPISSDAVIYRNDTMIRVSDYITDGQWNIGEQIIIQSNFNLSKNETQQAGIKVIDTTNNIISLIGTIDTQPKSPPTCDIDINMTDMTPNNADHYQILLTIANEHHSVPARNIITLIEYPNSFFNTTFHYNFGNYDSDVKTWFIPVLYPNQKASFTIRTSNIDSGLHIVTSTLQSCNPMDINPENDESTCIINV